MKIEIIKIGEVNVDSGQLMICDPAYIDAHWKKPDSGTFADHAHPVYRHKVSKTLWQFTYGQKPQGGVNALPGHYDILIEGFGKSANELIASREFERTDIDPTPHIPKAEFSYRGICKGNNEMYCQLEYAKGRPGVAVAFSSGFGDGTYGVFAEIAEITDSDKRIKKVWIELIQEDELS
jgi:hypothetical protein